MKRILDNYVLCFNFRFRFGEIMKTNTPILRETIKDASMTELRVSLRKRILLGNKEGQLVCISEFFSLS